MAEEIGVPTGCASPGSRMLADSELSQHMGTQRCPWLAEALLERFMIRTRQEPLRSFAIPVQDERMGTIG